MKNRTMNIELLWVTSAALLADLAKGIIHSQTREMKLF